MDAPTPTRSELLARRRRATLAVQGRDLLQDKRAALVRAFQARSTALLVRLEELSRTAARAHARLDRARAELGTEAVASASFAATGRVGVRLTSSSVAGVVVVDAEHAPVRRDPAARGYATTLVDPHVDAAADAYEQEVQDLLDLAALELTVRRLAEEIASTTRRVNGLEHVVIPRLRSEARRIALALDEREREETARLKRARARARRRATARATHPVPTPSTPGSTR
ncbi:V-type ATP synthase subunit D [Geodermatophilus sp. DSM 44513]|uniref:V-type ATP synthase subunit D n=1 Tax=Geodermatophilus sp. DSM 44513 TaxID=1528104 RepID=UPI00126F2B98|nr:V-type ATP synthase subunit D [Geodermatophilus sp. DSM 44513]WNV77807.1 V-type ATP synthase subunit D [Geodermatophilus sp. DSM 44513]